MESDLYHLIVYAPVRASDSIRKALADAGAGHVGDYDSCSFSTKGTGRFRPLAGSRPSIGSLGNIEEVEEEKIEVIVTSGRLSDVLMAVREAHPYEEPAIHIIPMIDYKKYV